MVCVEMIGVDINVELGDLSKSVIMENGPGQHQVKH